MIVYTPDKEGKLKERLTRVMTSKKNQPQFTFQDFDRKGYMEKIGPETWKALLDKMLLTRNLEIRAEAAYQQGKIGGFFHAYIGQEAIQTACVDVFGKENWWSASYRCHALALLLGASPNEIMAELFGRSTGNAHGRGGSMHLYADRLLGGFGIVAGQTPVAVGAALTLKYQKKQDEVSFCFLGDGAVVQGVFFESVNLATLWDLPCVFVIENNQWGMGTAVNRAVALHPIGEKMAEAFGIKSYTLDGMDLIHCHYAFEQIKQEMQKERKPIIIEAITERFRGHSISDPGLYRSKDSLKEIMQNDVLLRLKGDLIERGYLSEEDYSSKDKAAKNTIIEALKYAEESPWPDPIVLEEGVLKDDE